MDPANPIIALDRSMRRVDADGHLHVEMTNISKANVCPYYGREIPDYERHGLRPDAVYMLYRDPEELKAAAHTFAGKPLLMQHIPVTSDAPATDLVVGAIGTDVSFVHPYLKAPLSVWRQDAIDAIDRKELRELSPGYRYTADMQPGRTPEGVAFHGRMRNIMCNHLAIVGTGRTGPDVFVADEAPLPKGPKMKFAKILAALAAAIPGMSATQALALDDALGADLLPPSLATDAKPKDMTEDAAKAALDSYCKATGKAMDALTDEDKAEAYKRAARDANPAPGMDEAAVTARVATAVAEAIKDMVPSAEAAKLATDAATAASAQVHATYAARKAVESTVGATELDSAEAVYRFALDHLKVEHKDIPATALAALYTASAKVAPAIATDQAATKFDPSILGLSHIRKG